MSLALEATVNEFDEDGEPSVQLSFLINPPDMDDFEDLLLFLQKQRKIHQNPEGTIDWWIDPFGDGSVN